MDTIFYLMHTLAGPQAQSPFLFEDLATAHPTPGPLLIPKSFSYPGHFHDERCEMSVRNDQLTIDFHPDVAVTNGRFTPLIVEMHPRSPPAPE